MKLVFYSGGDERENMPLHEELVRLSNTRQPKITYIPSCSYDSDQDYLDFVAAMAKIGIRKIVRFPIDIPIHSALSKEAFKTDAIFMSGGNTFYFLNFLRKNRIYQEIRHFAQQGGVVSGLSAGAILMTPSIDMASIPAFDRDENELSLASWQALGLVKFHFFPHYVNSKRYDEELIAFSNYSDLPIYACPNYSGIVVDDQNMHFYGKNFCFYNNFKMNLGNK